jgi:hypothetical protein
VECSFNKRKGDQLTDKLYKELIKATPTVDINGYYPDKKTERLSWTKPKDLEACIRAFNHCEKWIKKSLKKAAKVNKNLSSLDLRSFVAAEANRKNPASTYIPNGVMILALMSAGYKPSNSLYPCFDVTKKS